jgi:hypothetical protein
MIVVSCNNCFYKGIKSYSCNECNNYSNHKLCKTANSNPSEPVRYGPSKYNPPPRPDKPMKEPFNPKQALLLAGKLSQAVHYVLNSPVIMLEKHIGRLGETMQSYDNYIFDHAITGKTKENEDEIYAKELKAHALGFAEWIKEDRWRSDSPLGEMWSRLNQVIPRSGGKYLLTTGQKADFTFEYKTTSELYAEYLKTLQP